MYHHLENITETHELKESGSSHFGGDDALVENFIGVMQETETSKATLEDGVLSATMCLLCKKSAEEKKFFDIE